MSAEYYLQGRQGGALLYAGMPAGQGAGPFRWIQVLQDTVFSDIVDDSIVEAYFIPNLGVIPAGIGIGGNFTGVELVSGSAIGYRA